MMYNFEPNKPVRALYGDKIYIGPHGAYYYNYVSSERIRTFNIPAKLDKGTHLVKPGKYSYYSDAHLGAMLSEAKSNSRRKRQAKAILNELHRREQKRKLLAKRLARDFVPASGKNPLQPDNPCIHEKLYGESEPYPKLGFTNSYTGDFIESYPGGWHELPYQRLLDTISQIDIQEMVNNALEQLKFSISPKASDITGGLNLWTVLLELKETLNLPRQFVDMLKTMPKSALTGIAQEQLFIKWGIEPLKKDAKSLIDIMFNLGEKLDAWYKYGSFGDNDIELDTRFRIRRRTIVIPLENIITKRTWVAGGTNTRNVQWASEPIYANLIVTYQIRYRALPVENLHQIILDLLGVTRPLSGVWEGIPFSWLIDYFIKVGDFLEGLEPQVQIPFEVFTSITSVKVNIMEKYSLSYEAIVKDATPPVFKAVSLDPAGHAGYQLYKRDIGKGNIRYFQAYVYPPENRLKAGSGLSFSRSANIISLAQIKRYERAQKRAGKTPKPLPPSSSISSTLSYLKKEIGKGRAKRLKRIASRVKIKL